MKGFHIVKKDGVIIAQMSLGGSTVFRPLPENLARSREDEIRAYFDQLIPELTTAVRKKRRKERQKLKRKT